MATRDALAELAGIHRAGTGTQVAIECVGGVEAARRIRAGEPFDVAILADEVMARLESEGRVVPGSRVPVAASGVAVAVRAGSVLPDIGTGDAVRAAILQAPSIGYSTGPSGAHLGRLLERWGIAQAVAPRLVQAPPGVPVGSLVASGQAGIGFQQLSELVHQPGIQVVGPLPPEIQAMTLFSGGICATATHREATAAWLSFIASPERDGVKRRHGLQQP